MKVGPLCVDVYEASLWDSVTGGRQVAASRCDADGNDCTTIFARSVAAVRPSATITWFQAQQACANAGKRLLTNAEWQMAAAGTPDGSTDSCNTSGGDVMLTVPGVANTGSFGGCVSNHGVNDMVGNLSEWVADWVPQSTAPCPGWATVGGFSSANLMCLAGASTTKGPGALVRGGSFEIKVGGSRAGVFAVRGDLEPSVAFSDIGFRCAR